MRALGLLALVAIVTVLVLYATVRSRGTSHETSGSVADESGRPQNPNMQRWINAGLLSEQQALAIEQFESERRTSVTPPRLSPAIEALAYIGATLVAVGAGMLASRFWDDLPAVAHLAIIGTAASVTGVIGFLVGEAEPVATRLRAFLWALSAVGFGAFVGLFVSEVLDRTGEPVAFATAATMALVSGSYWMLRGRPLQHALTFIFLVVACGIGIAWAAPINPSAWIGLTFWMLGAIWAFAAWNRRLPPEIVGFTLGVLLTLVGAGITGGRYDWLAPILGLATAATWTAIGIGANEVLALAPGVTGIFIFLPWTLGRFFGESLGAPVIVMLSGALLLAVVVMLWRRRSHGARIGDLWGGHFGSVAH